MRSESSAAIIVEQLPIRKLGVKRILRFCKMSHYSYSTGLVPFVHEVMSDEHCLLYLEIMEDPVGGVKMGFIRIPTV